MQHRRHSGLHFLCRSREVAFYKPKRPARRFTLAHHQRGGHARPFLFQRGQFHYQYIPFVCVLFRSIHFLLQRIHLGVVRGASLGLGVGGGFHARLVSLIEKSKHPIKFNLFERVKLMVMALRATEGESKHYLARGCDAVKNGVHPELLLVHAALGINLCVAMKPSGNALGLRRLGQHVARELLDGKLVERLVRIERRIHPIAITPHHAGGIVTVAIAVRIACLVQPVSPPAFAKVRGGQEAVHGGFQTAALILLPGHLESG